jgi:hypothetical protein
MAKCIDYIKKQLSVEKIVLDGFQLKQHSEYTIKENSNYWLSQKIPFNSLIRDGDNFKDIKIPDFVKEKNFNFDNRNHNSVQINNIKKIQIFK